MDLRAVPALLPALGVLAGATAGLHLLRVPVALAVALLAAATALGGRGGRLTAGAAAGLLAAAIAPGVPSAPWQGIVSTRPVAAQGRVVAPWRRLEWGWRGELEIERMVQGRTVLSEPRRLAIELAGVESPPARGSRLRARGYLGRPAGYANRIAVPPGPWRLRVKTRRLIEVLVPPGSLDRAAGALRRGVEEALAAGEREGRVIRPGSAARPGSGPGAGHGAGLVRALVLGEPGRLPPAWRRGLRRAGLAHLLAVSGLHAGLVAAVVLVLTAPLPRPLRIIVALCAVAAYLAVVGPRPALLRASGMVLIAGLGVISRRGPATANALAVVAGGLVLVRPELVADVGFRLTVSATAGIVLLASRFDAAWRGDPGDRRRPRSGAGSRGLRAIGRGIRRGLAASAAAQLASLPLALPVFHLGSWVAPLLNLIAVPYAALALASCLAWTALALASPAAAGSALPLLDRVAAPFGWPALGPPAAWGTVAAEAPRAACWAFAAVSVAWLLRPRRRAWLAPVAGSLGLVCCGGVAGGTPGAVSLTLLDVGQGDAILLADGSRSLLVDGGGWRHGDFGGRVLLPALLGEGVDRLEAVALTHPDADHCHGLAQVASYLPVEEVWLAPHWVGDPCADELAATPGARTVHLAAGGVRRLGAWRIEVLHPAWPDRRAGEATSARANGLSLVLRAEAYGRCALLTGDLDRAGERELLRRFPGLRCDLLKVGHHGSKTSTGVDLLAALAPRVALISAGRGNPYGHPAGEVVRRLERSGATVLRTDRLGLIRLAWAPRSALTLETPAAPPTAAR